MSVAIHRCCKLLLLQTPSKTLAALANWSKSIIIPAAVDIVVMSAYSKIMHHENELLLENILLIGN